MQRWIVYTLKTLVNRRSAWLLVLFETRCAPVVTQVTATVNANNFSLAERTIWQGFEALKGHCPFLLKEVKFSILLHRSLISVKASRQS